MKLKVCGMKDTENIQQVGSLQPDYLGFVFYEKSKQNFEGIIPEFSKSIKKIGVFVNEYPEIVISLVEEYRLDVIQLLGDESVTYIEDLKLELAKRRDLFIEENKEIAKKKNQHYISDKDIEVIKVFSIKDTFNFDSLKPYLEVVDYFLFDIERGENEMQFDCSVLKKYPFDKPFFLSGGIGLENVKELQEFIKSDLPIFGLDVNSKFETKPGIKDVQELKRFKEMMGFIK